MLCDLQSLVTGYYLTTAFAVAGMSAWMILHKRTEPPDKIESVACDAADSGALRWLAANDHLAGQDPMLGFRRTGSGMEAKITRLDHDGEPLRRLADALNARGSGHADRVAALTMIEPPADRPGSNSP